MKRLQSISAYLLALALLVTSAGPVQARSEKEQERLLIVVLNAHEYRPNKKVLDKIGPEVNRLLIRIATYHTMRATVRVRALSSLALYPSNQTRRYLLSLFHERSLKKSPSGLLLRRQAIRSAARAFRASVIADIITLKTDRNVQIREAVAHALGDTLSKQALPHLRAWLPHEKELFIRLAIEKSITRITRQKDTKK